MVYDLDMLKAFYASFEKKIGRVRAVLQRPLTLAEKILYTHLYDDIKERARILQRLRKPTVRYTISYEMFLRVSVSGFGNREQESFIRWYSKTMLFPGE